MAESVKVQLDTPVEFGGKTICELTIRPPKAKHMRKVQTPETRKLGFMIELAGYLAGEVSQVIDELEWSDLQKVLGVVSDFLGGGTPTGDDESPA